MTTFGPYELLRRLGAGGTAEVFLASGPNPTGDELLAVKIVLGHLAEEDRLRKTLLHEARVASLLRHRNIVQIFDVGEADGRPFLAMEFIRGWPLNVLLKRLREREQALSLGEACAIAREAAFGLHCAHEARDERGQPMGLVHRDVSPHNLMVRDDGRVKVVDFGLAKATLAIATRTGGVKGKLAYMPPEQIEGKTLDRRTDVFALGAVLWEMLCGEKLYTGRTEAEILQQAVLSAPPKLARLAPGLPAELVEVVEAALERDVSRRLPTAQALADALQTWTTPEATQRLAQRLQSLFEPQPRTLAEAMVAPRRPASGAIERPPQGDERPGRTSDPRRPAAERPLPGDERPGRSTDPRRAAAERPPLGGERTASSGELRRMGTERPTLGGERTASSGELRRMPAGRAAPGEDGSARPGEPRRGTGERPALGGGDRPPRTGESRRVTGEGPAAPAPRRATGESALPTARRRITTRQPISDKTEVRPNPFAAENARENAEDSEASGAGSWQEEPGLAEEPGTSPGRATRRLGMVAGVLVIATALLVGGALALGRRSAKGAAAGAAPAPERAAQEPPQKPAKPAPPHPRHAATATLDLSCDELVEVREGGQYLGQTPVTLPLSAGVHHLEFTTLGGGARSEVTLTLRPGEQRRYVVKLPGK